VNINGLLQSSASSTPVPATTFSYDALARPLGLNDPATGSNTKAYSSTTGQLISDSHGSQTTTYDYYTASDPNAGRLKAKTDPSSKKVYYNYNSRGDVVQTWGDGLLQVLCWRPLWRPELWLPVMYHKVASYYPAGSSAV